MANNIDDNEMNLDDYSDSETNVNKDNLLNYKGYFKENENLEDEEPKYYEHGAHFPYLFLYQKLEILQQERAELNEPKQMEPKEEEKTNIINCLAQNHRSRNKNNLNYTHNNDNFAFQPEISLKKQEDKNSNNFSALNLRQKEILQKIKTQKENTNLFTSFTSKSKNISNKNIEEEKNMNVNSHGISKTKNKNIISIVNNNHSSGTINSNINLNINKSINSLKTSGFFQNTIQQTKQIKTIKMPNSTSVRKKTKSKSKELQIQKNSSIKSSEPSSNVITNNKDKEKESINDIDTTTKKNTSKILTTSINNILMGYKYKKNFNFSPKENLKISSCKNNNKISFTSNNNKLGSTNNTINFNNKGITELKKNLDLSYKNSSNTNTKISNHLFHSIVSKNNNKSTNKDKSSTNNNNNSSGYMIKSSDVINIHNNEIIGEHLNEPNKQVVDKSENKTEDKTIIEQDVDKTDDKTDPNTGIRSRNKEITLNNNNSSKKSRNKNYMGQNNLTQGKSSMLYSETCNLTITKKKNDNNTIILPNHQKYTNKNTIILSHNKTHFISIPKSKKNIEKNPASTKANNPNTINSNNNTQKDIRTSFISKTSVKILNEIKKNLLKMGPSKQIPSTSSHNQTKKNISKAKKGVIVGNIGNFINNSNKKENQTKQVFICPASRNIQESRHYNTKNITKKTNTVNKTQLQQTANSKEKMNSHYGNKGENSRSVQKYKDEGHKITQLPHSSAEHKSNNSCKKKVSSAVKNIGLSRNKKTPHNPFSFSKGKLETKTIKKGSCTVNLKNTITSTTLKQK